MAATVYNGTLVKDQTTQTVTLYNNNTSKNVRIVFNWLEAGSGSANASMEFYFGETSSPNWNSTPYDDTTWFAALGVSYSVGKYISQPTTNSQGAFPLEVMMKPNHSIYVKMGNQINGNSGSPASALRYNFVAITED